MKTQIIGFFTPCIAYIVITLLHYFLPAKWTTGYVKNSKTGELLHYRLNGIYVLALSIVIWYVLGMLNWVPLDWFYQVRWSSLAGAITIGLLFSIIIVLPYPSIRKSLFADLWFGRLANPQIKNKRIDAKMWLYLVGAVMLQLNVLSFAVHHFTSNVEINPGLLISIGMLSFFIWEYLNFERVHLYTYDFIAERVGLKLGFGCLTFYPYFYAVSIWATVDLPNPHQPLWLNICCVIVFLVGWGLARGANMQKYYFKTQPERKFLGIKPETISDGCHTLLVNGFWGLSRHINYLGEILMGCAIALSIGYLTVFWVWLYPLYYVGLLVTRQIDDDKICKAKYGDLWDTYKQKVKYRIIPYIY